MTVLPDQQDLVRAIQGQHGHGAGMKHHVPFCYVIVGHAGPYRRVR